MEAKKIECHNCARIIEEDEIFDYFDGKGFSDLDQAVQDCEDPIAPDVCDYFETTLSLIMECPNCQSLIEDVKVDVEAYGDWRMGSSSQ